MKKLRVTVDGKVYEVAVQMLEDGGSSAPQAPAATPAPAPVQAVAPAPTPSPSPAPAPAGAGDVASPLAGKVVSVDVQVGAAVKKDQQVLTLEAMKMNTYIYAPKDGKVESISVKPGDAVEEGQALLRIA